MLIIIWQVLYTLSESLFDLSHSLTLQRSSLKLTFSSSELGWDKKTVALSAELPKFNISDDLLRSFQSNKNNYETKFDAFRIPESTTLEVESVPSTATYCIQSVIKSYASQDLSLIPQYAAFFFKIILWQAVSKVLDKSM